MRQHAVSCTDKIRAQIADRVKLLQIGKVFIKDREVDIQALIRNCRHSLIEGSVEIDDRVDTVLFDYLPIADRGRYEKPAMIVDLIKLHLKNVHRPKE